MTYLEYVNQRIREVIANQNYVVCFGQNINNGSFIGGLTKGLEVNSTGRIINATCNENALVGMGFGLAMNGAHAILFMKQLDFLLLGLDQCVNTWNAIRNSENDMTGSFTIIPVVIDSGWQGPQSSFNALDSICSMGIKGTYINNNANDIDRAFRFFGKMDGFSILALSHKLCSQPLEDRSPDCSCPSYSTYGLRGSDIVIVSCGFTLSDAFKVADSFKRFQKHPFIISYPHATAQFFDLPLYGKFACMDAKKIIVLDDSKSMNAIGDSVIEHLSTCKIKAQIFHYRHQYAGCTVLRPNADATGWNHERIAEDVYYAD